MEANTHTNAPNHLATSFPVNHCMTVEPLSEQLNSNQSLTQSMPEEAVKKSIRHAIDIVRSLKDQDSQVKSTLENLENLLLLESNLLCISFAFGTIRAEARNVLRDRCVGLPCDIVASFVKIGTIADRLHNVFDMSRGGEFDAWKALGNIDPNARQTPP